MLSRIYGYSTYKDRSGFDIITISMTIKSLPEIEPLAKALPLFLKPGGR